MPLKRRICHECNGKQYVFRLNIDGEYDCEPCYCLAWGEDMIWIEVKEE